MTALGATGKWQQERKMIALWIEKGLLPDPRGKVFWDLGAGNGEYSASLLDLGAAYVLSSDIQHSAKFDENMKGFRNFKFALGSIDKCIDFFEKQEAPKPDVVFMNLMTEHVYELRTFFQSLSERLKRDTELVIVHDNYWNPMGHHDHAFLKLNDHWVVEPVAVPCWSSDAKCKVSMEHRESLGSRWSDSAEETRNPNNCARCNYFRRSQPWAHLISANEFAKVFPEVFFQKQLNKVTPPQVALYLAESNFTIVSEFRSWVMNKPPVQLVNDYGLHNLTTFAYVLRAVLR